MAKKPEPQQPIRWEIFKIAKKAVWVGSVEAPDKATAIEAKPAEPKSAAAPERRVLRSDR